MGSAHQGHRTALYQAQGSICNQGGYYGPKYLADILRSKGRSRSLQMSLVPERTAPVRGLLLMVISLKAAAD